MSLLIFCTIISFKDERYFVDRSTIKILSVQLAINNILIVIDILNISQPNGGVRWYLEVPASFIEIWPQCHKPKYWIFWN